MPDEPLQRQYKQLIDLLAYGQDDLIQSYVKATMPYPAAIRQTECQHALQRASALEHKLEQALTTSRTFRATIYARVRQEMGQEMGAAACPCLKHNAPARARRSPGRGWLLPSAGWCARLRALLRGVGRPGSRVR